MDSKQATLTALGCAGSLAAMLAMAGPAIASPTLATATPEAEDSLPTLTQADSNPITDALRCGCARCTLGEMKPSF